MAVLAKAEYVDTAYSSALALKDSLGFLLVTATSTETKVLHSHLVPLPGYEQILKVVKDNQTYYLARLGVFGIIHVQCEMGSVSAGASTITVRDAIEAWHPKAAIMVGIAFGIDKTTQRIGDVLVSECVLPYDNKKISKSHVIQRGTPCQANRTLLNRFKNSTSWQHVLPDSLAPRIIVGHILSGECLIDDTEFRDALVDKFESAKGGEMEGAGLFAAAESKNVPWIIVKGICDFADGNKSENKDESQMVAAVSSVSLCQNILTNEFAFDAINVKAFENTSASIASLPRPSLVDPKLLKAVLFDLYTPEMESYYIKRLHDTNIQSILDHSNLWVSGPTGCGKTNLILRALHKSSTPFRLISLANYIGSDLTELFRYLYLELLDNLQSSTDEFSPNDDLITVVKRLSGLLSEHVHENLCVYIEEISNIDDIIIEHFIRQIFGILIGLQPKISNSNIKFIFSSISEPLTFAKKTTRSKLREQITFYDLDPWGKEDISSLLRLIDRELKLQFSQEDAERIIVAAEGSPRFIKHIIRKRLVLSAACSLDGLIAETKGELS